LASLGLSSRSYSFDSDVIDEVVTRTSPGNYALGYKNEQGKFIVNYVGRSDNDLNQELKNYLPGTGYRRFKFGYAQSPKAAFEKECENYHDFDGLDNEIHPRRPDESDWICPRCDVFA